MLKRWREPHPLEGPALKLLWAEKDLDVIDEYIVKYNSLHPYRVISELNDDKTFYECRIQALFPPFLDFGVLAGEIAYQLRSTLDHLIFALSKFPHTLQGKKLDQAHRSTGFPIMITPNEASLMGKLRYIPDAIRQKVRDIVDAFQPYQGGDRAEDSLLVFLDDVNVRDKHRVINAAIGSLNINMENMPHGIELKALGRSVDDGDVIALVPAHLNPEVDLNPRLTLQVALPVRRDGGTVLITDLRRVHNEIRDKIIPRFARFFPPRS